MAQSKKETTMDKRLAKSILLKQEILKKYKSVRQFSIEMDIPYSTLVTALDRGVDGMAYGTVIRICDKLNLNPVTMKPLDDSQVSLQLQSDRVLGAYLKLNQDGKDKAMEIMDDLASIKKYKASKK